MSFWSCDGCGATPGITYSCGCKRDALDVDALANEIRRVDGNHSLGAGALAEALMPFFQARAAQAAPPASTDVRNAALEEAALLMEATGKRIAASDIRAKKSVPATLFPKHVGDVDERAVVGTPRYKAWLHLRTHGQWPDDIPEWAKDHNGHMNDMVAARAVIEELAAAALSAQPAASEEPSDALSENEWYDLAQRHATRDWNGNGYMAAIQAVCLDFLSRYGRPAGDAQPVGHVSKDSAIAHMSVNLPEGSALYAAPVAAQKADDDGPTCPICGCPGGRHSGGSTCTNAWPPSSATPPTPYRRVSLL